MKRSGNFIPLPTLIALAVRASAQGNVRVPGIPQCLAQCIQTWSRGSISNFCTPSWNSLVSSCVDETCSLGFPYEYGIKFIPERQFSCQQNIVPPYNQYPPAPTILLYQDQCFNTPYEFKSFFPDASNWTLAEECVVQLYSETDCGGSVQYVNLRGLPEHQCISQGGLSATLACNATDSDNAYSHRYLDSLCAGYGSVSPTATVTPTTLPSGYVPTGMAATGLPTGVVPVISLNGSVGATGGYVTPNPTVTTPAAYTGAAALKRPEAGVGLAAMIGAMMIL